jgi:hypothetical protein
MDQFGYGPLLAPQAPQMANRLANRHTVLIGIRHNRIHRVRLNEGQENKGISITLK